MSRGFAIVVADGVAFAAGGGAVGNGLARLAPLYYRAVFHGDDSPGFDPVPVAVGLGVSQGLVAGVIVVLAVALSARRSSSDGPAGRD